MIAEPMTDEVLNLTGEIRELRARNRALEKERDFYLNQSLQHIKPKEIEDENTRP